MGKMFFFLFWGRVGGARYKHAYKAHKIGLLRHVDEVFLGGGALNIFLVGLCHTGFQK